MDMFPIKDFDTQNSFQLFSKELDMFSNFFYFLEISGKFSILM